MQMSLHDFHIPTKPKFKLVLGFRQIIASKSFNFVFPEDSSKEETLMSP